MLVRYCLHEDPLEAIRPGMHGTELLELSMFHQDECRQRAEEIGPTSSRDSTGGRVRGYPSRSFNPVGDRSGLRQCCRSRTLLWIRSFYLPSQFTRKSTSGCSQVSLLSGLDRDLTSSVRFDGVTKFGEAAR